MFCLSMLPSYMKKKYIYIEKTHGMCRFASVYSLQHFCKSRGDAEMLRRFHQNVPTQLCRNSVEPMCKTDVNDSSGT